MTPQAHSKSSNCESGQTINPIEPDRSRRCLYRNKAVPSRPRTLHLDLNIGPVGQIKDDDHEDVLPI